MSSSRIDGDLLVTGTLLTGNMAIPANAVGDAAVNASSPITAAKLQHQNSVCYRQSHGSAVVAQRQVIYFAYAAGTLTGLSAGVVVACIGGATITVNLYKNGSTILSAAVVLDNTNTAFSSEVGAFSSAGYVAGDVFEVVVTVAAGGGTIGQGLFVNLVTKEAAA